MLNCSIEFKNHNTYSFELQYKLKKLIEALTLLNMKTYDKEDVSITWNPEICIHAGNCARGLPSVFKPKEKPWIDTNGASKEAIISQVSKCPSGALGIRESK